MKPFNVPRAPIPGENHTSDERNYPWHRPPDIVSTDEAIDYVSGRLTNTLEGAQYMELIRAGVTVAGVTDMIVSIGIMDGKWTPDFAILIAGPVARMLEIMAKVEGIDYDMGLDLGERIVTAEYIKAVAEGNPQVKEAVDAELQDIKDTAPQETDGLMAMAPQEEQDAMLGYGPEDPLMGDVQPDITEETV